MTDNKVVIPTLKDDLALIEAALKAWRNHSKRFVRGGLGPCHLDAVAALEALDRLKNEILLEELESLDAIRGVVRRFYERVCIRAEENIAKTNKLEGSHYAAMRAELHDMGIEVSDG